MQERRIPGGELLFWVAFSWGACTFFPVGVAYAHMLFALACIGVGWRQRLPALRQGMLLWPMAMVLAWTMLALVFGAWFDDSATRLFHIVRVLLLLLMGMSLSRSEATMAIGGFLVGAVLAAMIVAVHHVWGLPPLTIWNSLLKSRQNFSSGNMIMMAIGASLFFHFGLRNDQKWIDRKVAWGAAAALLATVAAHAISRNAQILLPMLFAVAILYHFRAWRAVLGGLILAGVMVLGALQWSATTQERFGEMVEEAQRVVTAEDYTTSVGERWRMHEEAIRGMMAHPIFGTGLGSWLPRWRVVAQESIESLSPEKRFDHVEINNPHNDFLLAGMETGIPGMLALVWMLVAFLVAGWRQRSTAGGVTVIMAAGLAVTALVNAPLRDAALGMTLLFLLGASVAGHKAP
ncbi:MAG TPA: O-antigen ligase family protein [Burkholderiaceae bacterium]|nr:O-antigen ligase family protein [Burkholderiaceae bacterium]